MFAGSKTESTATRNPVQQARTDASSAENPHNKPVNISRQNAPNRAPLTTVTVQPTDRHRPAAEESAVPVKSARIETTTAPAPAPAPVLAPAPAPETEKALSGPHRLPDLAARRAELVSYHVDIDTPDLSDPMFCSEYVEEIYDYLRQKEVDDQIDFDYMSRQPSLTPRMRMVLIDWMVEVQLKFRMTTESLYLSVNIVDKYLQVKPITRERLQLLGVTALHIASKFEEVYSVDLNDFVFICDNACTAADIIAFEGEVLRTIHWCLTTPYPLHFVRRFSKAAGSDGVRHTMSKYLTELSLGYYKMLKFLPSTQAAAAVFLTRRLMGNEPYWPDSVKYHSLYVEPEILECAREIHDILLHPDPKFRLVTRKYSSAKFCYVARIATENAPKFTL